MKWRSRGQTVPGKGWFTILRPYSALDPWFDKTWRPGDFMIAGPGWKSVKVKN